MGVARAGNLETVGQSNAQIVGGGLKFGTGYLTRTPGSAGNRTTWTWSCWAKRNIFDGTRQTLIRCNSNNENHISIAESAQGNAEGIIIYGATGGPYSVTSAVLRDPSAWYHIVLAVDTTSATANDRYKIYINNVLQTSYYSRTNPDPNYTGGINSAALHSIGANPSGSELWKGSISQVYFIDGQALDPSYFGYTDPLTNTWRPKKYVRTTTITGDTGGAVGFGTNGFWLPFDGNSPIGQDMSGKGNNWTPVNFGGSNTIEKATGAFPILNTDGGGKIVRAGVRTDSNASSLVLALPLVGIKSDFSNRINSGTTEKVITANGNTVGISTISNFYGGSFYFDGSGDYLSISSPSSDIINWYSTDYTLEYFIYANAFGSSANGGSNVLGNASTSDSNEYWSFGPISGGTVRFYYWSGSQNSFTTTAALSTGRWNHLAFVKNSTSLKIYINGVESASTTLSVSPQSGSELPFLIGKSTSSGDFNGYLQDLRIYKGLAKYTQNFIPASTDPDILPDTPSGVSYSSTLSLPTSNEGGSLMFDGSGDYLRFSQSSDWAFGTGDFSIEYFIFPNYTTDTLGFGGTRGAAGTSAGWNIGLINEDTAGGYIQMYSDGGIAPTNAHRKILYRKWTHVVYTRSGSTIRAIIDGVLHNTASNSQNWTLNDFSIGITGAGAAEPYLGFLSNIRIIKGSIPTSYQTSSTTLGTKIFDVPTSPLTTTSQGATSGDVKFLGCNSLTAITDFTVTPNTPTVNGNVSVSGFNPFSTNINTVRGRGTGYCTFNQLASTTTLSNGNLDTTMAASPADYGRGTISMTSGKYYFEATKMSGAEPFVGVTISSSGNSNNYGYHGNGYIYYPGGNVGQYSTIGTGDIIAIAVDATAGSVAFYRNGILVYTFTGITASEYFPHYGGTNSGTALVSWNFGQKPFKFPPPAGFQPLALANTPRPTIVRPDQYVGIVTYSGNSAARSLSVGFKPDLVWIKGRGPTAYNGRLIDSVRGVTKELYSAETTEETTQSQSLTSFDSTGFSVGTLAQVNNTSESYVAWAWKAGGEIGVGRSVMINDVGYATTTAAGLTAGTIAPTGASINTKSGFSIITWTGNGSTSATVPHGLNKVPAMVILKSRDDSTYQWPVWHSYYETSTTNKLVLSRTDSTITGDTNGYVTSLTSTTFGFGGGTAAVNANTQRYVAYLWAEIPGFSKFGSYTGNGSTNFVNVGFRPRWIMIKRAVTNSSPDQTTNYSSWTMYDTTRNAYNGQTVNHLYANKNINEGYRGNASSTADLADITINALSNGFYLSGPGTEINANTGTYIYAAFAETPNFNLYGGQSNAR